MRFLIGEVVCSDLEFSCLLVVLFFGYFMLSFFCPLELLPVLSGFSALLFT